MISKKILVPVFSVVVSGAILLGGGFVLAHAQTPNTPFSGLAQAIASKFNLNEADVQSAISSYRQQQMINRQKMRLDRLVSEGKITSSQESAILQELATIKNQFNSSSLKGMTQTQRQQAFQNERNVITQWAQSQNPPINPAYVFPFGMGHKGGWNRTHLTPTP